MRKIRWIVLTLVGVMAAAAPAVPSVAGGADARPIILAGGKPTDPASFPWLDEAGRKVLADEIAQRKSGALQAFVFVGAPGGMWAGRVASKPADLTAVADLARMALQVCELLRHLPCYIVSVNGQDMRAPDGSLIAQPSLLSFQGDSFDPARVPFLSDGDRYSVAAYAKAASPRVLAITSSGGWLWRGGKSTGQAVAAAMNDCAKSYPNDSCILYAIGNHVVFDAGDY